MTLSTPLSDAGRVYKMYAKRLEKLGIQTLKDFLFHLPSRYDDYSLISRIGAAQAGDVVTIQAVVKDIRNDYTRSRKQLQRAIVSDETGDMHVLWFNQPYIAKSLSVGAHISLSGRVESENFHLVMTSPDFEIIPEDGTTIHTGRFVPIYPETAGVSSKWLRRQIFSLLKTHALDLLEFLPEKTIAKNKLKPFFDSLSQIHFPTSMEEAASARHRLAFDEVLLIQLSAMQKRLQWQSTLKGHSFTLNREKIGEFINSLPFELTGAQLTSLENMFFDMQKQEPMNRLLEGDVGSGKTVVAAVGMYLAHLNGFQSVLMAPTEILATQHFATISRLLEPFQVKVALSTGSKKTTQEKFDIVIGTHAVLSEKLQFEKLGFVVIDEQQRFGVQQRAIIREKGENPHVLTMTATPIPRTVALTLYGDLDLSVLDEMPKGRKEIKTWLVPTQKRDGAYKWIREKVQKGDQVFVVCPFIEESENMTTIKAATQEFERLQKSVFPDLKLGLLHGKQKAKEKDTILQSFRNHEFDILVATPVVEVGIDIPNATI
ncbi:MAG TPA: ATP-dependent DNA helicase RecG, partial [Patescibacteria group bacterium]|nr:ATP-dependent DNA helicase RecG [Patescibacteria group bacterium]